MKRIFVRSFVQKRNFQFSNKLFNVNENTNYLKKKIEVLETELKLQDQSFLTEQGKQGSTKGYKLMQELVDCYIKDGQLDPATNICAELYRRTKKLYGERHIMMIDVYYQTAHVSFYTGFYHQAYNDYVEIIEIKKNAISTGVKVENLKKDEEIVNFLSYISEYFQNIQLTDSEKKDLHFDDPTVPLSKLLSFYPVEKRYNITKVFLSKKVNQENVTDIVDENSLLKVQNLFLLNRKLAILHMRSKKLDDAISYFEVAHKHCLEAYGKYHPVLGSFLADYAEAICQSDPTTSERFAKHATVIFSKVSPEKLNENPEFELQIAKACMTLVYIYMRIDPSETIKYIQIAIQIFARIHGKNSVQWKSTAIHMANLLIQNDEGDKALEFLDKEVWPMIKDTDELKAKTTFFSAKAFYYVHNQQYSLAKNYFYKCLELMKTFEPPEQIEACYLEITQCYYSLKDQKGVLALIDQRLASITQSTKVFENQYRTIREKVMKGLWLDQESDSLYNNTIAEELRKWKLENLHLGVSHKDQEEEMFFFQKHLVEKCNKDPELRKILENRKLTKNDVEELIVSLRDKYGPEIVNRQVEERIRIMAKAPHHVQDLMRLKEELEHAHNMKDPKFAELWRKHHVDDTFKGRNTSMASKEEIVKFMEEMRKKEGGGPGTIPPKQ